MNRDREKQILEILLQERRVSVSDLAKRLYASEPSIRRDLIRLESRSLLKRIHGGAILRNRVIPSPGFRLFCGSWSSRTPSF